MKTLFKSRFTTLLLAAILILFAAEILVAVERKEARITQVVRDVKLLTSQATALPAALNENVREGTAVRTGIDSRAELTFNDQSLTRLGANTVFNFGPNAHDFNLTSGAILLAMPPSAGTAHIRTSAVSAAISGGVVMGESHKNSWKKFIILEGKGVITLTSSGQSLTLFAGQMIVIPPGARTFGQVYNIDLKKLTDNSLLIRFAKLPPWVWALIQREIDKQETTPPSGGLTDPTGFDAIDQRAATLPTPEPKMRHPSPPPRRR